MKYILFILFISFNNSRVYTAPIILDFGHSHTVEDLERSDLEVSRIAAGLYGQAYSFHNQEVEILLPAGRTIIQNVVLGTIDTKDKNLTRLSLSGQVMPHDQAVNVMRMFHDSFDLPLEEFKKWEVANRGKVRNAEPYSISANLNFYPRISLGVRKSMNALYPWVIELLINWDWDKHRDWNEDRVWRELPQPLLPVISLNPPSGENYQRGDAYKEILHEQADIDQGNILESSVEVNLTVEPTPVQTQSLTEPSDSIESTLENSPLWRWTVGGAILVFLLIGLISRFHTGKKK